MNEITHCWNCGYKVENTELHTYYCEKCELAFVLKSKDIRVVAFA